MIIGIIIGLVGILGVSINYFIYKKLWNLYIVLSRVLTKLHLVLKH
jgi:uncharacterized membrane protein